MIVTIWNETKMKFEVARKITAISNINEAKDFSLVTNDGVKKSYRKDKYKLEFVDEEAQNGRV